jgi:hypothetical protein
VHNTTDPPELLPRFNRWARLASLQFLVLVTLAACGGQTNPFGSAVTLGASPAMVTPGSASTLTWSSTKVTSCTASGGWSGKLATRGSQSTGALTSTTQYTLTCTWPGGSASKTVSVPVVDPAFAAPALVQHVSLSNTRGNRVASPYCYYFPLPNPTTAGNAIVVGFTFQGNVAPTVTDDKNDTYAIAANHYDSDARQSAVIAAAFNVAAGARNLSLCFSADPGLNVQPMATELTNLISFDGAGSGNHGRGTTATSGSLTPSASGDLVYQITFSLSLHQSRFSAGSGQEVLWTLLSADLLDGWGGQYGLDSSASTFAPTMGLGSSDKWVTAAALFKTGATGSVPSGLRIVHLLHENVPYFIPAGGTGKPFTNPVAAQFPCSGNLLVAMTGGGNGRQRVSSLQDSNGNGWSSVAKTAAVDAWVQAYYAPKASCSDDLRLSAQFSAANGDYTIFVYDVANAAATPLDASFVAGGSYPRAGSFPMPGSLTPAISNEIVFTEIMWDYNTGVGLVPGLFDGARFTGESLDGPEPVDENNGWGHYITSSTRPVSFTWNVLQPDTDPVLGYAALAVAFKGK